MNDFKLHFMLLTERPTVPRPKITTVDPLDMSATFQAAPMPNHVQKECSVSYLKQYVCTARGQEIKYRQ